MLLKRVCPVCFGCNHFHRCFDTDRLVYCFMSNQCLLSGSCNPYYCSCLSCFFHYNPDHSYKNDSSC